MSIGLIVAYISNLIFWGIGVINTWGNPLVAIPLVIFILYAGILVYSIFMADQLTENQDRGR